MNALGNGPGNEPGNGPANGPGNAKDDDRTTAAGDPLAGIRRPRLLIRAARLGLADYSRSRDLKRIMRVAALPAPTRALKALLETEAEMEETRRAGGSTYSVIRHVEVMIALMAEARLFPRRTAGG